MKQRNMKKLLACAVTAMLLPVIGLSVHAEDAAFAGEEWYDQIETVQVTRQQLATFFYKYAELKDYDIETRGDYSGLLNADQVASYAADTMQWAYGTGLITGSAVKVNGVTVYDLKPTGTATRAQVASILMRFCENNGL